MSQKLAIDVGHGFTKALSETGERVLFPSLICPMLPHVDLGELGKSEAVTIDGVPYLVGESARQHATPLWSRDKADDPDTLRLMLIAAAQLGAVGPVQLATGLPLAWYGAQRKAFREALTGFGGMVQLPGQSVQRRLWFESVKVLPQGLAASLGLLTHVDREPGDYLVVDLGYRTTDYLVVTKESTGHLAFDPLAAGSLELGTHAIASRLASELEHAYAVPFTPSEVEKSERIFVDGQAIVLSGRRAAVIQAIQQQLGAKITETLDARVRKLSATVVCGGGASVLSEAFTHPVIPPDPQWANVAAYLQAFSPAIDGIPHP